MVIENEYYSQDVHGPFELFSLGDFELEMGEKLRDGKIAYITRGTLNTAKDNAILFPHMYSGTHKHMEIFVGEGMALDPKEYFIILPGQICNGLSTSPHNTPPPFVQAAFPKVTTAPYLSPPPNLLTENVGIVTLQP